MPQAITWNNDGQSTDVSPKPSELIKQIPSIC